MVNDFTPPRGDDSRCDLFDLPDRSIIVKILGVDAEIGFGLLHRFFVGCGIQAHGVFLSQIIVVFEAETVILVFQYSGRFHGHVGIGVWRAQMQASAR